MRIKALFVLLSAPLAFAGCAVWIDEMDRPDDGGLPLADDDDAADDDAADDDAADDDAADDDAADDDAADDDVADDDTADDDTGDDDTAGVATVNVPADFPTIQDAVDNTPDGSIIEVDPGTYYERGVDG